MLCRFGSTLAQSSAGVRAKALAGVEAAAGVWFVEQRIDLGNLRLRLRLFLTASCQSCQRGHRKALKVATRERLIGHDETYFLGRPTAAEHRLQRLISVFIFAPHLEQRRALSCLTNFVRGRLRMADSQHVESRKDQYSNGPRAAKLQARCKWRPQIATETSFLGEEALSIRRRYQAARLSGWFSSPFSSATRARMAASCSGM